MLLALLAALLLSPFYWLLVPAAWRRDAVTLASVLALGWYDLRLGVGLMLAVRESTWRCAPCPDSRAGVAGSLQSRASFSWPRPSR
jgi:hypothetical protein